MKITDKAVEAFTQYRRNQVAELRPWQSGDDMSGVSVSAEDAKVGSPKSGDMIARNPKNHADQWLVAAAYFADNFEPLAALPHLSQGAVSLPADDTELAQMVEDFHGGSVAFAHDPDQMHHLIEFTPPRLREFISTLSPAPAGVTDESVRWEDVREFIYHRAEQLKSQTPRQVFWALADDMSRKLRGVRALDALASHEPAPTDTQEGVNGAGEVVGYRWRDVINPEYWHVGKAHKAPSYASKEPLVRQSALTACQKEVARLRKHLKERLIVERALRRRAEADEARNAVLEKALNQIDALNPEEHLFGVSHNAYRGLIARMGEIARAALGGQSNG